jgi:uncharacterized metal-binding protein YceD (DUF177 family)
MTGAAPEFSRRVELHRLGRGVASYALRASPDERLALARRFDLLALDRLEAEIELQRVGERLIRLEGSLSAELAQACVVSLEPVPSSLSERFTMLFGPGQPQETVQVELEGDFIDPIDGDAIDIGEAVSQQLALLLDPYPRAPGARLEASATEHPDKDARRSEC